MESKPNPNSLFFDANVLVSASLSIKGPSYKLLDRCAEHQLIVMFSKLVKEETERTLLRINKKKLERYEEIMRTINENTKLIIFDDPSRSEIESLGKIIHKNDAPILAAALKANPDYLITINRRHFIKPKVKEICPFRIMTPDWFLRKVKL